MKKDREIFRKYAETIMQKPYVIGETKPCQHYNVTEITATNATHVLNRQRVRIMGSSYCLPKATCPLIDEVIDKLEDAVKDAKDLMEQIRKANSELREAAECWQKEIDEVEEERDKFDDKLSDALSEIEDLKAELKSLEKEMAA